MPAGRPGSELRYEAAVPQRRNREKLLWRIEKNTAGRDDRYLLACRSRIKLEPDRYRLGPRHQGWIHISVIGAAGRNLRMIGIWPPNLDTRSEALNERWITPRLNGRAQRRHG